MLLAISISHCRVLWHDKKLPEECVAPHWSKVIWRTWLFPIHLCFAPYQELVHDGNKFSKVFATAMFSHSSGNPVGPLGGARWDIWSLQSVQSLLWSLLLFARQPNQLHLILSTERSTGSTPSSFQVSELCTLRLSPATLQTKLILATCICNVNLWVTTMSSWPQASW